MLQLGELDRPDQQRKFHPQPVPRVGGIVIAASYATTFATILVLPFSFQYSVREIVPHFWSLLPAVEVVFITGLIDDIINLKPWQKLFGQVLAAVIAFSAGVRIDSAGPYTLEPVMSALVTVLWLLVCTNAFNLIDGMDGLAAGVGLFVSVTVFISALTHGSMGLAIVTAPLIGCLLGFLRYNFNPASVFLGDSGSLLIGFLLGCFAVLWAHKAVTLLGMTAPLMAFTIPLLDATLTLARRFLRHQPIFQGDRGHIHHRLLDHGLTPRRAALLVYGISGLAAAFAMIQDRLQGGLAALVVILFGAAACIGVEHLGYVEFGIARRLVTQGTIRRMIDRQTTLTRLEQDLQQAATVDEIWERLQTASRTLGFCSVSMHLGEHDYLDHSGGSNYKWQVQIRISNCGWISFRHDGADDLNHLPVGSLASVVSRAIEAKLSAAPPAAEERSVCAAG